MLEYYKELKRIIKGNEIELKGRVEVKEKRIPDSYPIQIQREPGSSGEVEMCVVKARDGYSQGARIVVENIK